MTSGMNTSDALQNIEYQTMWHRLLAIVEEQAQTLLRTAFSPIVRECGDLSAGVFDTDGRMLAQAVTGAPGHVNTMAESVRHFLRRYPLATMREGDVFLTNDPWMGTGHLNDFVMVTPTFRDGEPVALFCATSHIMDIGGLGFGPDATDVYMEGLYIPLLKLFEAGALNSTLMEMIRGNTRQQTETEGDIYALVACNAVGSKRLVEMMNEFGLVSLNNLGEFILRRSRDAMLEQVRKLPRGTWRNAMTVDGYGTPIEIHAALTVTDDGVHIDYTGSSPQSARGINVPITYATAYSLFGLACGVSGNIPNNSGSLSVFTVSAPPGCIVNAQRPAPVSTRHVLGQMLPDVVFGCLRQIVPERVPAEGTAAVWLITLRGEASDPNLGTYGFTCGFTANGGTGARGARDGLSATAFPTSLTGTPVEIAETQTPLVFWRKELRENSGGAGKTRGGLGQVLEIESLHRKPFEILASFDRIDFPPRGHAGGDNGASGFIGLASGHLLQGKGAQTIEAGERLVIMTPGGAGRGDPRDRDASRVSEDIVNGLISPSEAALRYGSA